MKKPYSLDYTIEKATDRMHAVEDILDTLPRNPTRADLELFANYILYGTNENNERVRMDDFASKRYKSYNRKQDFEVSLESLIDGDNRAEDTERDRTAHRQPTINRPTFSRNGAPISQGDADVPGMVDLWDSIDRLTHLYEVSTGEKKDPKVIPIVDPYRQFQLKHWILDLKRHQYYLKEAYKPTIRFLNVPKPSIQTFNFCENASYWLSRPELEAKLATNYNPYIERNPDKYETRELPDGSLQYKWVVREQTIDLTNPKHIRAIMRHYSNIYMQLWDKPDSWGRALLFSFDAIVDEAYLNEIQRYVLLRTIDGAEVERNILPEIEEKFGRKYCVSGILKMRNETIPREIANAAERQIIYQQMMEGELYGRFCTGCGEFLPIHPLWFPRASARKNGYLERCKKCAKERREWKKKQENA